MKGSAKTAENVSRAEDSLFGRLTFDEMTMAVMVFLVVSVLPGVAVAAMETGSIFTNLAITNSKLQGNISGYNDCSKMQDAG